MSERPNILWVSFEDTNPFYGCYDDPVAKTPNLDQLASEGCRWSNAYSTAGVCAPARSAIITGMYAISTGCHHMRTTHTQPFMESLPTPYSALLPPHVKCFPEYLRAAGYFCTNAEKCDYQFECPQTAWDELGLHAHWRNRTRSDQPFFSVFNLEDTHESKMWAGNGQPITFNPDDTVLPSYFPDTPKVRESMAQMYSNIEYNDRILGKLLQQLEDDGLAENTIVFHWSDHGPLPRGKRWLYDSGIRVPMIVRWPKHLKPGLVSDNLISTLDLAPTVLSLTGLEMPQHMQGQAFLGDDKPEPRQYVHATRDRHDCTYDRVRCIRDKRYKYLRNYYPEAGRSAWNQYLHHHPIMQELWRLHLLDELTDIQESIFFSETRPVEELYDIQADPHEINNLARDPHYLETKQRLSTAMDAWLDEVVDMGAIPEQQMVDTWYPNGEQPQTATPVAVGVDIDNPGIELYTLATALKYPALLILQSCIQGASIAYRLSNDPETHWRLYTGPISLKKGHNTINTKAVRIGYKESEIAEYSFEVMADNEASQPEARFQVG